MKPGECVHLMCSPLTFELIEQHETLIKQVEFGGRTFLPSSCFKGSVHYRAVKMPTDRLKCCLNTVSDNCFVLFLETLRPCDKNNADGL